MIGMFDHATSHTYTARVDWSCDTAFRVSWAGYEGSEG